MSPDSRRHPRRTRRRLLGCLLALGVVLASCETAGGGRELDGANGIDPAETAGAQQLDCERMGYPCSWDEAEPDAVGRTDELLTLSSLLLADGLTAPELADRLEQAAGVAEVAHSPIAVWFRVDGAVPVFVYVDPTDGGQLESSPPPLDAQRGTPPADLPMAQDARGSFTGCGAFDSDADEERGPVGRTGEAKDALILGAWKWQMTWDVGEFVESLRYSDSDYARDESVIDQTMTLEQTPSYFGSDAAVRLEDFCGWERYDTIVLKTHGRTVCPAPGDTNEEFVGPTRCFTGLSVGRFAESVDELRAYAGGATGVTVGVSKYGNLQEDLEGQDRLDCIEALEDQPPSDGEDEVADRCLEQLPEAGHLEVTTDFFAANYGNRGGLKDRMVFISACQGMAPEGGLARAMRGSGESSGAILGFDRIITTPAANAVLEQFARNVALGFTAEDMLDTLQKTLDDYTDRDVNVRGQIESSGIVIEEIADVADEGDEATRGSDIVSLHAGQGGPELRDDGTVGVKGVLGDGDPDEIDLGLRMTGLAEDRTPDDFDVQVLFDGQPVILENLDWDRVEEGIFDGEATARLPVDVADDATFDLEILVPLPDAGGAFSRWEYENLRPSGCFFRFAHSGSIQRQGPDYSGPVDGNADFAWAELEGAGIGADDPGGMQALNFDAGGQKMDAASVITLSDQDPLFRQIVLGSPDSTRLPLGETGTHTVPAAAQLSPEPGAGAQFAGQVELTITDSSVVERAGRPFIGTLEGTFRSVGVMDVQGLEDEISGEVRITDGEFAFDAAVCAGAMP